MLTFHIVSSIDISSGGPSKSVCDLALEQAKKDVSVQIISLKTEKPYFAQNPHPNLNLVFTEKNNFKASFKHVIKNQKPDILHGHGLWLMEGHYMASIARNMNIPYIISPRGMLEPWALNYKRWKKQIALWLYQNKDVANAACIHTTAKMEAEQIRKLGFKNPIAVIPNPIEVKDKIAKVRTEKKRLAFIGRLHKIKNIESLIKSWEKVTSKNDWELVIVGDGEPNYVNKLKKLVIELEISSSVIFTGFLTGIEKENLWKTLDIIVLPSFSENFGMVVGEALQYEIPVIASTGTPWEDLNTYQCGWWVNNNTDSLAETIQQAISLSDEERQKMGKRGRQLIIEKYSVEIVATQMLRLYEWILKGGEKPEFVYEQGTSPCPLQRGIKRRVHHHLKKIPL
ncbi:MAG: glycosyltransferase [Bacteroidales bacterium]